MTNVVVFALTCMFMFFQTTALLTYPRHLLGGPPALPLFIRDPQNDWVSVDFAAADTVGHLMREVNRLWAGNHANHKLLVNHGETQFQNADPRQPLAEVGLAKEAGIEVSRGRRDTFVLLSGDQRIDKTSFYELFDLLEENQVHSFSLELSWLQISWTDGRSPQKKFQNFKLGVFEVARNPDWLPGVYTFKEAQILEQRQYEMYLLDGEFRQIIFRKHDSTDAFKLYFRGAMFNGIDGNLIPYDHVVFTINKFN